MKRRSGWFIRQLLILMLAWALLSGCGDSADAAYKDGTFIGRSSVDELGAYGEATLTIDDNKIVDSEYVTWQSDGTIKDEEYGKAQGEVAYQDYYDKAQHAVEAMKLYAQQLVEVQSLQEVDAISGATISYRQFVEAVEDALAKAKE